MSEYSVKIFLILFTCSGLLSLFISVYLKVSAVKRSPNPAKVRVLARKYLLRGVSTTLLSVLAYVLVLKGLLASWMVLLVLAALLLGIEFLIVKALHFNVPIGER